jgi:hypothetical protein
MVPAFDRAERDGINHHPGFDAGFDREQAAGAL